MLSGTHLPTLEGCKAKLALQRKEIGRSVGVTFHKESNLGRSNGSTMVYPLCYSCFDQILYETFEA